MLVGEGTVEKYKADMGEEIEPQIAELISRAEKGTKTLQKKHQALQTKVCVCARAPDILRVQQDCLVF